MNTTSINLRLSPDTAEEFKNFCQENGITQADGFEAAIKALELTNAEEAVPDEKATIDSIRTNLDGAMEGVLTLLQHLTEANDQAHDAVQSELNSKDQTIADMSETQKETNRKITELEQEISSLRQQVHEAETEKELAQSKLQAAQNDAEAKYKEQIARLEEQVKLLDTFKMLANEKRLPQKQESENNQDNDGYEG